MSALPPLFERLPPGPFRPAPKIQTRLRSAGSSRRASGGRGAIRNLRRRPATPPGGAQSGQGSRSDRVGAWPRGRARRWRTGDIVDGRCQPDCVATRPDVLRGSSRSSAPWRRRLATGEAALTGEGLIRRGAAERPSPYRGPQKPPAARLKSPRPRFGIAGACG
jgi:hypothetical protein